MACHGVARQGEDGRPTLSIWSIRSIRSISKRHAAGRGYKQLCYRAPFYTDKQTALTARECNIELPGIEADSSLEKFADDFCRVLDNGKHTAICFPDDLECIRLIKLLQSRGMQIPGDAGAVSWDGLTVSCYFSPMLETPAVPHDKMCRAAEKFLCGSSCGFIEFSPEIRSGETLPVHRDRRGGVSNSIQVAFMAN